MLQFHYFFTVFANRESLQKFERCLSLWKIETTKFTIITGMFAFSWFERVHLYSLEWWSIQCVLIGRDRIIDRTNCLHGITVKWLITT